ncbi:SCP2 sterol-binding domain-containing protein [Evansella sp. AB-rgal1]|uniref:SCP2 sterol-binding domain-containing protein n=1 Tax=Evansella sp. AB-rgal1 TaxID=3242696 RepID=UPI00359F1002
MQINNIFNQIVSNMKADPIHLNNVNAIYEFHITGETESVYQLVLNNGDVTYIVGAKEEPTITLVLSEESFLKMTNGSLNPTVAYMSGKLKVKGDLSQALKLQSLLKQYQ